MSYNAMSIVVQGKGKKWVNGSATVHWPAHRLTIQEHGTDSMTDQLDLHRGVGFVLCTGICLLEPKPYAMRSLSIEQ